MRRIMFAGTSSSSGKTTISCGFMKALTDRGLKVASFKCGPDYIDPMFHEQIVGMRAGNLDGFFLKNEGLRKMLWEGSVGCDIAVLEGAMGCYDGIGFTREASSYEVAAATDTPIVLVVGVRGMAASMVALVRGFLEEDRAGRIRGVILNQLPAKFFPEAKRKIEAIRPGLICYGYVPVNQAIELKSRHLGLVTPEEVSDRKEKVSLAAEQIEESVDVEGLIRLAGEAGEFFAESPERRELGIHGQSEGRGTGIQGQSEGRGTGIQGQSEGLGADIRKLSEGREDGIDRTLERSKNGRKEASAIRIAVAKDRAFSFLYRDNLNWLKVHGAEPVFFSPLEDERIPDHCQGMILPGGYPELHLEDLEKNTSMRASVRSAIMDGMPTIAECGGFLYLLAQVEGHDLVGILPQTAKNARSLGRFGYIYLTALSDGLLAGAGETMRAHEFHHYTTDDDGHAFRADKASGEGSWETGCHTETLYAGFPHIYFPGNERAGERFLAACAGYEVPNSYYSHIT